MYAFDLEEGQFSSSLPDFSLTLPQTNLCIVYDTASEYSSLKINKTYDSV
jgi:hypothetical protein